MQSAEGGFVNAVPPQRPATVAVLFFRLWYLCQLTALALRLFFTGQWRRLFGSLYARLYVGLYHAAFPLVIPSRRIDRVPTPEPLRVDTQHPVAYTSPDHQVPHGTKYNNSTNRKFVLALHDRQRRAFPTGPLRFLDLGCSGGQLVADFRSLGWTAAGLEGSDYSLKHQRANWRTLAGQCLFTCDIARPFTVHAGNTPASFHLITAWEVLEHIQEQDLSALFNNIQSHLAPGGLFIASTSSSTSIVDGVELHQTRWPNTRWREWIQTHFPQLQPVSLPLRLHHFVRYDFGEPSHLVYEKR